VDIAFKGKKSSSPLVGIQTKNLIMTMKVNRRISSARQIEAFTVRVIDFKGL